MIKKDVFGNGVVKRNIIINVVIRKVGENQKRKRLNKW
jgi:hypothetical protein